MKIVKLSILDLIPQQCATEPRHIITSWEPFAKPCECVSSWSLYVMLNKNLQ